MSEHFNLVIDGAMKCADDVHAVLVKMGFETSHLRTADLIQERHGNRLFRITLGITSYVLKVFGNPAASSEIRAYDLLRNLGVPTLRTIVSTNSALLLEDLEASGDFRLASVNDVETAEVGVALAHWYQTLHDVGSRFRMSQTETVFLRREIEELTPASILDAAAKVGDSDRSKWITLADNIDRIKDAAMASAETVTYNDFHWTNLALSRDEKPIRAIVFDYHLLGLGLRYSDYRNVLGSLGRNAASAFRSEYGEADPREKVLDDLMAPLFALLVAFRRSKFPSWAEPHLELAKTGEIHNRFKRVMQIL